MPEDPQQSKYSFVPRDCKLSMLCEKIFSCIALYDMECVYILFMLLLNKAIALYFYVLRSFFGSKLMPILYILLNKSKITRFILVKLLISKKKYFPLIINYMPYFIIFSNYCFRIWGYQFCNLGDKFYFVIVCILIF